METTDYIGLSDIPEQVISDKSREIWRKNPDAYSPSIHITEDNDIMINVGSVVHICSVEKLHKALLLIDILRDLISPVEA